MLLVLRVMIPTIQLLVVQPNPNVLTTPIVATTKFVQHCPTLFIDNVLTLAVEPLVGPMPIASQTITI